MSVTDWMTDINQIFTNFSAAPLWAFGMDVIDELDEIQLVLLYRLRFTVNSRTVTLQCLALLNQWTITLTANHLFALSNPALTSALSKKSFSKVRRRFSPPSSRCREPGFIDLLAKSHCYAQRAELSRNRVYFKLSCNVRNRFVTSQSGAP